jgi:hypothetical protein
MRAINQNADMRMGACRAAFRTGYAQYIALVYNLADLHIRFNQVIENDIDFMTADIVSNDNLVAGKFFAGLLLLHNTAIE